MSVSKREWWHTPSWQIQLWKIFTQYLLPISAVVTAVEINWLIAPHVSFQPAFLTFWAAIMVTAWYGHLPSALVSIVLSSFALNYYFIPPIHDLSLSPADLGTLAFFALEGLAMAYCIDYLRRNESSLRRANLELEQQIASKRQELSDKEERLRGLMHQLAAIEERERRELAAELHDYLAQLLSLARMKIKQAQQHMHRSVVESQRFIAETDDLLHTCVNYVRTLMAELYPAQLNEMGLPAALRWLAVDVSICTDSLSLPDHTVLLLYQSARELLMNIVKHAEVNRAFMSLDVDADCLFITVQDRGRGFDPPTPGSSTSGQQFGLQSVRDRLTSVGGMFSLESRVGKGTSVTLTVPLESDESLSTRAASTVRLDRTRPPAPVSDQQSLHL
jgi:signal transduction histidine kinase